MSRLSRINKLQDFLGTSLCMLQSDCFSGQFSADFS